MTKSGTSYTVYVNGEPQVTGTLTAISITKLNIGRRSDPMLAFTGILDEVRISNTPRSANWILTEYNNQNNPSAFFSVGSQESAPNVPSITNPSPSNQATVVSVTSTQLSFDLSSNDNQPMTYSVTTSPSIGSTEATNVANGIYTVPISGLSYGTTYTWTVQATEDGTNWATQTFTFTTQPWNMAIVSYSPQQADITINRGSSQTFQISFSGSMDATWYLNNTLEQTNLGVTSSSWTNTFSTLGICTSISHWNSQWAIIRTKLDCSGHH